MKQKSVIIGAICFTFAFFIFNTFAYAQEYSGVAQFLFELGKKYYEQGAYKQARHELEKALQLLPGHSEARRYIRLIEREQVLASASQQWEEVLDSERDTVREEALRKALDMAEARASEKKDIASLAEEVISEKRKGLRIEEPPEEIEQLLAEEIEEMTPQQIESMTAEEIEEIIEKKPKEASRPRAKVAPSPIDKFKPPAEEALSQEPSPLKISGDYVLSLGVREGDVIWKEANGDYNETNWRRVHRDFGVNTYDTRVYDRLRLNLDTEEAEGFNLHSNITIDPWSFTGKSESTLIYSNWNDVATIEPKYWSGTRSTINETVFTDRLGDTISLPEIKVDEGKTQALTVGGATQSLAGLTQTFTIPELEIDYALWPIRELWVEYRSGDEFSFRFFPIAYEDQVLTSDDPLQLSNHMHYWEESPWLDRWQPGILNAGAAPVDFIRGEWEDDLSFFTRDSNMTRLSGLRGFSLTARPQENLSIESTVASPKGLWQDYDAFDNIEGATRIKVIPQEQLQLGLIHTFRYGLQEGRRDAENRVLGGDITYALLPDLKLKGEVAFSQDERDLTQEPYDTKKIGNAYKFEIKKGELKEERPEKWDKEALAEEAEPFDYALRLGWTHMDKGFYPALATYRLTRKDPFWGRHLHFAQPYKEYYAGLYYPSLTWDDIRFFRIGDSVDINRDVAALRVEKAFLDGDLETLFDCRNVHAASSGKYIETVARTEADWQLSDRLLIKFLGIYHDLPDTIGGIDPIIYDVDSDRPFSNAWIEDGKNPSLKTASTGFKYGFFDWLSFDFIYEYTNDFTVALDDYPRGLLNGASYTTYFTEEGLNWREINPWLNTQQFFPTPPYPWFGIYKAGLEFVCDDDLKLRLEFTKNDYKYASQVDDNMNHLGLAADWAITDKLALKFNYTYSKSYNLYETIIGQPDYDDHHNVFVNFDYKTNNEGVFSLQFGEAAVLPYSTMFTTSPYPGFLPTLDTVHIVRAYFSQRF